MLSGAQNFCFVPPQILPKFWVAKGKTWGQICACAILQISKMQNGSVHLTLSVFWKVVFAVWLNCAPHGVTHWKSASFSQLRALCAESVKHGHKQVNKRWGIFESCSKLFWLFVPVPTKSPMFMTWLWILKAHGFYVVQHCVHESESKLAGDIWVNRRIIFLCQPESNAALVNFPQTKKMKVKHKFNATQGLVQAQFFNCTKSRDENPRLHFFVEFHCFPYRVRVPDNILTRVQSITVNSSSLPLQAKLSTCVEKTLMCCTTHTQ